MWIMAVVTKVCSSLLNVLLLLITGFREDIQYKTSYALLGAIKNNTWLKQILPDVNHTSRIAFPERRQYFCRHLHIGCSDKERGGQEQEKQEDCIG